MSHRSHSASSGDSTIQNLDQVGISDVSSNSNTPKPNVFRRTSISSRHGTLQIAFLARALLLASLFSDCIFDVGFFSWLGSWTFFDWWKLILIIMIVAFIASLLSAFGSQIQAVFLIVLVRIPEKYFVGVGF
jgi:hypothetical protein